MSKQNGDVPYQCETYSIEAIKAANERHDRVNGWSHACPHQFTNLGRFPETTTLPAERAFERPLNRQPDALERDLPRFEEQDAQNIRLNTLNAANRVV